ncbi:hypothetical protein KIK06_16575 [Nocardiopsis sp. EMB25]|uniref:hypothetical protein n=1 Tax=Nocardiopsis sp. EMB25 TaxID=2835867 RepID=UPI002283B0E8|nr:hypothetical protein [Nocardiopsis sp. EMB25]MCY9785502.1 hypothetical protein [Nocardiopsis sp. EMB25]
MSTRPVTLVVAAALEALIGLAAAVGGVYSLVTAATGQAASVTSAIPLAFLGVGAGAVLVFVARGLLLLREWARTPVVVTQLFLAVVAYYMFTSEQFLIGGVLLAVALCAAGAVLAPPTTAVLFPPEKGE